jgi:hypothetical protein
LAAEQTQRVELSKLVELALAQGIKQVEAAGSPLHPLLFDDTGKMMILFDESGAKDPMELACDAIRSHAPETLHCALAIDTRITLADGKKWDAIVVMACTRGSDDGTAWAQRYVPKGLFRKFRAEGAPEQVGKSKDFITVALSDD